MLSFWHRVATESTFDGGVLEFSTDNGATWSTTDPTFITGGYNATISTGFGSPIAGRHAWSGTIGSTGNFVNVQVNLMSYAGQANLRFRFREANDSSVTATGWWVDDVTVTLGLPCAAARLRLRRPRPVPPTATDTATSVPPTNTPPAGSTATATSVPPTHRGAADGDGDAGELPAAVHGRGPVQPVLPVHPVPVLPRHHLRLRG